MQLTDDSTVEHRRSAQPRQCVPLIRARTAQMACRYAESHAGVHICCCIHYIALVVQGKRSLRTVSAAHNC